MKKTIKTTQFFGGNNLSNISREAVMGRLECLHFFANYLQGSQSTEYRSDTLLQQRLINP